MKLKTLKDLQFNGMGKLLSEVELVKVEDLREEAIKWVKFYKTTKDKLTYQWEQMVAVKFMEFFNITEEDLK